jgi:hypothetical protein
MILKPPARSVKFSHSHLLRMAESGRLVAWVGKTISHSFAIGRSRASQIVSLDLAQAYMCTHSTVL